MDVIHAENQNIGILADCCPNTKYLYYRKGRIEMPLHCLTPGGDCIDYKFQSLPDSVDAQKKLLHPMYSIPDLSHDTYVGPVQDSFLHYVQLLKKDIKIIDTKEKCDTLQFLYNFQRQRFLNKRYTSVDSFDATNTLNILVLHHAYYDLASQFRTLLKRKGYTTFIMYMTDVTLAKLGNMNGDYIVFGCFNKTLNLLYSELSRFLNLYTAWDILYWLNKDTLDINFCDVYYLNPLDIPLTYFDIKVDSITPTLEIIKATSKYGSYIGLPTEDKPISKIQKGKIGIASSYH